jgi:nucleotide-binding universal stress UspA family protein
LNILLAYDGSSHAEAAIDLIKDLPLVENSHVTILGVLIPRESSNHSRLENALNQAKLRLSGADYVVSLKMELGYPAEQIVLIAEETSPDLIVMGAKGLRATLGILLGGVAQQVVEYASQPVLIVRAPYNGLNNVLLVTDGSMPSQHAVEYLAGSIRANGVPTCQRFPLPEYASVRVMNVLPPFPYPEMLAPVWPVGSEIFPTLPLDEQEESARHKEEEKQGQQILDSTVDFLKRCSSISASPILVRGDAATEIIDYVKSHQIDLIIAGSRGLSEMRSWILGSVSRKLVHYSGCSVLIVKRTPPPE